MAKHQVTRGGITYFYDGDPCYGGQCVGSTAAQPSSSPATPGPIGTALWRADLNRADRRGKKARQEAKRQSRHDRGIEALQQRRATSHKGDRRNGWGNGDESC